MSGTTGSFESLLQSARRIRRRPDHPCCQRHSTAAIANRSKLERRTPATGCGHTRARMEPRDVAIHRQSSSRGRRTTASRCKRRNAALTRSSPWSADHPHARSKPSRPHQIAVLSRQVARTRPSRTDRAVLATLAHPIPSGWALGDPFHRAGHGDVPAQDAIRRDVIAPTPGCGDRRVRHRRPGDRDRAVTLPAYLRHVTRVTEVVRSSLPYGPVYRELTPANGQIDAEPALDLMPWTCP